MPEIRLIPVDLIDPHPHNPAIAERLTAQPCATTPERAAGVVR